MCTVVVFLVKSELLILVFNLISYIILQEPEWMNTWIENFTSCLYKL